MKSYLYDTMFPWLYLGRTSLLWMLCGNSTVELTDFCCMITKRLTMFFYNSVDKIMLHLIISILDFMFHRYCTESFHFYGSYLNMFSALTHIRSILCHGDTMLDPQLHGFDVFNSKYMVSKI